jgi:hypothetical protein
MKETSLGTGISVHFVLSWLSKCTKTFAFKNIHNDIYLNT